MNLFLSDTHLRTTDVETQRRFARFLLDHADRLDGLYLLGDVFDFWFGYSGAIYHGYFETLVALRELSRAGVEIHYFHGNHDFHLGPFLERDLGVIPHAGPQILDLRGRRVYLSHGDEVNPQDWGYRILQFTLRNRVTRAFFSIVPPGLGLRLAQSVSHSSRSMRGESSTVPPQIYRQFLDCLVANKVEVAIHGHLHHRQLTIHGEPGRQVRCFSLGPWSFDGNHVLQRDAEFNWGAPAGEPLAEPPETDRPAPS